MSDFSFEASAVCHIHGLRYYPYDGQECPKCEYEDEQDNIENSEEVDE